ncbi:MAG: type 4a pilus biogenesis protein PilO [Acidobacteriota bacterium]
MAMQTGLEDKPWYVSAAVAAALAIGIVLAFHFLLVKKTNERTVRAERQLADLDRRIQEGEAAKRSLPQFREEVNRLELELDKLLAVLPSRRNTEDLLRRLRRLTDQGDFKLLRFTPRRLSERDFYYEWPIQIRLDGDYHNLALFFDRISRFSRIINIEDLDIRASRGSGGNPNHTIGASFIMKTFLYIDDEDGEGA